MRLFWRVIEQIIVIIFYIPAWIVEFARRAAVYAMHKSIASNHK